MTAEALRRKLALVLGLDEEGPLAHFDRALHARQQARAEGAADYARAALTDPVELEALVDELVVPETWFFRERASFDELRELARGRHRMRVLCAPCCSGEEAYSIAITLLEAHVPPCGIEVLGLDVSAPLIARAQRGEYAAARLRDGDGLGPYAERLSGRTLRIRGDVRNLVRFRQANLVRAGWEPELRFDAIFCRNLLIYLGADPRQRLLARLGRLLAPGGRLFVGMSEAQLAQSSGYAPALGRGGRGLVPRSAAAPRLAVRPERERVAGSGTLVRLGAEGQRAGAASQGRPMRLSRARRLLQEGALEQAADLCERALREDGRSAEGFYLLGLALHRLGLDESAESCLFEALLIEPGHAEARALLGRVAATTARAGRRRTA